MPPQGTAVDPRVLPPPRDDNAAARGHSVPCARSTAAAGRHLWGKGDNLMRRRRFAALVVALVFGSLLLAAPASAATVNVTIQNFAFTPNPVQVQAGDTVTWTNNQPNEPHTVTADDGSFSLALNPGESVSHTFTKNGTVAYYCKLHGGPG